MLVCFPVECDEQLKSPICDHFGSAPMFIIVDTENMETRAITNTNMHHSHGNCHPLSVLAGNKFDTIIVRGIGAGAIQRLNSAGYTVFCTGASTIEEALKEIADGRLKPVSAGNACGHHGHGS